MRQVLIIFPKALCGLEAIIPPCKKKNACQQFSMTTKHKLSFVRTRTHTNTRVFAAREQVTMWNATCCTQQVN